MWLILEVWPYFWSLLTSCLWGNHSRVAEGISFTLVESITSCQNTIPSPLKFHHLLNHKNMLLSAVYAVCARKFKSNFSLWSKFYERNGSFNPCFLKYSVWLPRINSPLFVYIDSDSTHLGRIVIWDKQWVLMHGHQGWNVWHGLCHIYMIYVYIWVVHSFCLFCCLFIIVTTQFVALYEPCRPKPKPSTYDTRTTTPWQRSKFRYLDRSQSNKYAINMQIQTISVSK